MSGIGFQSEADAERVVRATRTVERPEYNKRPDGMLGGLIIRPGDLYTDTDYREAVITWLDAATGTYTDDTETVLVRSHEGLPPPGADQPVFCTFHGYKDDYAVYLACSPAVETVALVKCTSNTVNGDGYQPGVIRVKDDAGGRSDGATVWMKATTGDQFRNNIEYILFLNGTVTSAASTRALYDGPASSGFEYEVCVDAAVQTNRLWIIGGIELETNV